MDHVVLPGLNTKWSSFSFLYSPIANTHSFSAELLFFRQFITCEESTKAECRGFNEALTATDGHTNRVKVTSRSTRGGRLTTALPPLSSVTDCSGWSSESSLSSLQINNNSPTKLWHSGYLFMKYLFSWTYCRTLCTLILSQERSKYGAGVWTLEGSATLNQHQT